MKAPNRRSPWFYVPTLYFAEGLPYILVNTVSVIMYKKMGVSNQLIGLTSILYLPWVIKMFWSPIVDIYSTKRKWILWMQALMAVLFAFVALSIQSPFFLTLSIIFFFLTAFISATHDIVCDGFYMLALSKQDQALFVGVRSTFYRLAMIFGSGLMVVLAGRIEKATGNIPHSWTIVFSMTALVFAVLFFLHRWYLPKPGADRQSTTSNNNTHFFEAFRTYFQQPKIWAILLFILFYRLGEAMLTKMTAPFLLDSPEAGGLGLNTDTVGFVYGTVGVLSLVFGGILGGWLVSKFGFRKCVWPMVFALNVPDVAYIYMAIAKPALGWVYPLVAIEQFGYGIGFTAFMVYLMYISKGQYKTSHYAISTGLMALGMMLPGMISGYLQASLGYAAFFIAVLVLTIPGFLTLFFIPMDDIN